MKEKLFIFLLIILFPFSAASAGKKDVQMMENLCKVAALGNREMINALIDGKSEKQISAMRAARIRKFKAKLSSGNLDAATAAETAYAVNRLAEGYYKVAKSALTRQDVKELRAMPPAERQNTVRAMNEALYKVCIQSVK